MSVLASPLERLSLNTSALTALAPFEPCWFSPSSELQLSCELCSSTVVAFYFFFLAQKGDGLGFEISLLSCVSWYAVREVELQSPWRGRERRPQTCSHTEFTWERSLLGKGEERDQTETCLLRETSESGSG